MDKLGIIKKLLAVPSVTKHDTRFANEVALVAPESAMTTVADIVTAELGAAVKPAGAPLPAELTDSPLLDAMGGARGGQTLYLLGLGEGLSIYVAFWPWGGGKKTTIKVGVHEVR